MSPCDAAGDCPGVGCKVHQHLLIWVGRACTHSGGSLRRNARLTLPGGRGQGVVRSSAIVLEHRLRGCATRCASWRG